MARKKERQVEREREKGGGIERENSFHGHIALMLYLGSLCW